MGLFSKKKSTDDSASSDSNNDQALARQDPRTRVQTKSAASVTTNTAVQSSTIIDSNANTVTYRSTTQTVTHSQKACVTEMITRRTPSPAELEELMAQLRTGSRAGSSSTSTTTSSSNKRVSPTSLNGVALRSTTSFKPNAEARRSSTLVKSEQTSVSQKKGRTVTQHVETHRVVLSPSSKTSWPPKTTASTSSASSSAYKPYVSPFALKPIDSTYVSPYASKTTTGIGSAFSKPSVVTPSALPKTSGSSSFSSRPTTTSLVLPKHSSASSVMSKPTTSSAVLGTKSTLSTPKTTVGKPFISLNPIKGGALKSSLSTTSTLDAHGEMNPTKSGYGPIPKVKPVPKKKLKPAEVIIFNNERFDNSNEFRSGSAKDVESLEKTFGTLLKCKVKTVTNPTVNDIRNTVEKLEQKSFEDRSALVLVILSHGQRYETIAAKDGDYKLDDDIIFPILRNQTLTNKPKILFVQACKGSRELGKFKTDAIKPHGNPSEILKCYSTYEGYVSYRLDTGTPFIQILCDTLKTKPNVDIEAIMKDVMNLVKSYTQGSQVPSVTSTMTTKYVFGDYV
ncbi:mucin-5AC [Drosophila navojoa]|uniref:mucin-5AC n=1 Tax=Drosophila navojoa TaxID=7232 RepID=UPI000846BE11|nr:mucin-5AC [Drosophila navojoa]